MKSRGGSARGGDVIPYIFCLGPNGESSKSGQADRAYHPEELRKSKGDLKIGKLLSHSSEREASIDQEALQILNFISRHKYFRRSLAYVSPLKAPTGRGSLNA